MMPLLLALQSVLGSLRLLDSLSITFYPTVHRATRTVKFDLGFSLTLPLAVLMAFWVGWMTWRRRFKALLFPAAAIIFYPFLGFEASVSMASLLAVAGGLWLHRRFDGYLSWMFLLLGGLEAAALLHWVVFVPLGLAGPFEAAARLEGDLFYVASYLAPLLVLPLMFTWVLKPLIRWGWGDGADAGRREPRVRGEVSLMASLFLAFTASLAVAAALYPYGPAVNPRGVNVGVDIPSYVGTAEVVERDVSQAFKVSGGARPLIYLAVYGFQRLLGLDAPSAVRFLPVLLNPLLAVAVFFMAMEAFGDGWVAGWASFFTVCGFPVTVGMYSYFLTDMLGLCLIFFSLGFLFRALRCGCRVSIALASLLGGLLVFTHPWTFDQYYAAAALTAVVVWYKARGGEAFGKVWALASYLGSLGLAELLKMLVFRGVGGVSASSTAISGVSGLPDFWFSSIFSFRLLYGGFMSSVVLLGLAVAGVYLLAGRRVPEVFLQVFMAATSLLFLVGDETIKSRLLYNVPIGVFASLGLLSLLGRNEAAGFRKEFTLFVVLNLIVYLFRSLANLI